MTAKHWPDGTKRSTGNGFDLEARMARGPSIFYHPARTPAEAGKLGGALSASTVATVKGLSERAQAQLNAAPKSITISPVRDTDKRRKAKVRAI